MPVTCQRRLQSLSKEEFGALAYSVTGDLFRIHNELGRFFDGRIYKRALATLRRDVQLEVPLDVSHRGFSKRYFLDVLLAAGAILEMKAVESLSPRHRAQLLHHLFLTGLSHGLLLNVRPAQVEKEFVHAALSPEERRRFTLSTSGWDGSMPGAKQFEQILESLLHDWGTCLELSLYEEALTHFLGGEETVIRPVEAAWEGSQLGSQAMRFAADDVAFRLTALEDELARRRFAEDAGKFLAHLDVRALLWVNIGRHEVKLVTLEAGRKMTSEAPLRKGGVQV